MGLGSCLRLTGQQRPSLSRVGLALEGSQREGRGENVSALPFPPSLLFIFSPESHFWYSHLLLPTVLWHSFKASSPLVFLLIFSFSNLHWPGFQVYLLFCVCQPIFRPGNWSQNSAQICDKRCLTTKQHIGKVYAFSPFGSICYAWWH